MLMRRVPLLIAALLAGALSGTAPAQDALSVEPSGAVRFPLQVRSLAERRFGGVTRQRLDFSCGSAAVATLLHLQFGTGLDESQPFAAMWADGDQARIRQLGFSLLDMKRFLVGRGLAADGYRVTLDQIAGAGRPGIALINFRGYRHFVVVERVDRDAVLLGDPALGLRWERRARFEQQWNGIFFVINQPVSSGGRQALADDAALAPRFPAAGGPLDAATLRLVRPVQGGL